VYFFTGLQVPTHCTCKAENTQLKLNSTVADYSYLDNLISFQN